MKNIFLIIAIAGLLVSCQKEEGKGGTSTIKGVVMVQEYNKDFISKVGDPYPAQDVDVYIVYGNDEVYGDRFKTGYDGKYEFNYLQKGKYTIYVMSKSLENKLTKELVPVSQEVEITAKNQVVEADTLNIID